MMKLKGGLEERGFHKYPWGVELPIKLIPKRHNMEKWLRESTINFYYHYMNYEFWFMHENDRIAFILSWS